MRTTTFTAALLAVAPVSATYWMESIAHQGIAPYAPDAADYPVFRNVRDYGAKGDGIHDDTAAINAAISFGNRCGPGTCAGNTATPATVYFPAGTYLVSDSLVGYFYTQIIGDAEDMPVIKASRNFSMEGAAKGIIDGNPYINGTLAWTSVNTFFKQVRNLVVDMTALPHGVVAVGVHWPCSQATSVNNVVFKMADAPGTVQTGLLIESGSGGYLGDLVFEGGNVGANLNNQQFTARNLKFLGVQTAVKMGWNWSWTYKSLSVKNCSVGVEMATATTGSMSIIDSDFESVGTAIVATYVPGFNSTEAGALLVDNVVFCDVKTAIINANRTVIAGGPGTNIVEGYINGNSYTPNGPQQVVGSDPSASKRPKALTDRSGKYLEYSKPSYTKYHVSQFLSARSFGATGDGSTDDTEALNRLFATAARKPHSVAFIDAGMYVVTDTVVIPAGAKIVGEALYSVILGTGKKFEDMDNPYPVVQVGRPGEMGRIEWSDTIVSTRGATAGAKLIEYNLYSPDRPSGIWDVHVRVGGFAGSDLQLADCVTTPATGAIEKKCIAAHTSIHITPSASGLYHENCWIWVADHDLEDPQYTRVTIYAGRGMLIEAQDGRIWVSGSGVEHHVLYQYQLPSPLARPRSSR